MREFSAPRILNVLPRQLRRQKLLVAMRRFLRGGGDLFDVRAHFGLVTFGVEPMARASGVSVHIAAAFPVPLTYEQRDVLFLQRSADLTGTVREGVRGGV